MHPLRPTLRSSLAAVLAGALALAPLAAQSKISETALGGSGRPVGVVVDGATAICSLYANGEQVAFDVGNPAAPQLLNQWDMPWGDQWNEAALAGSRLVTGHRFGGLNLFDVSQPSAPVQLDSISTNYHFAGLFVRARGANEYLYYSEHNASTRDGGLRIFDITGGLLTEVGSAMIANNQRDGAGLVTTGDHWCYQLDPGSGSSRANTLNVYDCTTVSAPQFVQQFDLGNDPANAGKNPDIVLSANETHLFVANRWDGLKVVDVTNRASPVVVNTLALAGYSVEELFLYRQTKLLATVLTPAGDRIVTVFHVANPANPVRLPIQFGTPGYVIRDMVESQDHLFVVADDPNGAAVLQIWR